MGVALRGLAAPQGKGPGCPRALFALNSQFSPDLQSLQLSSCQLTNRSLGLSLLQARAEGAAVIGMAAPGCPEFQRLEMVGDLLWSQSGVGASKQHRGKRPAELPRRQQRMFPCLLLGGQVS